MLGAAQLPIKAEAGMVVPALEQCLTDLAQHRHCEEPEGRRSNPEIYIFRSGLLRFARNDDSI
jgi:hypothetical protein